MSIAFDLHLTSEAELGTGMASQYLNSILARDSKGKPFLRATHLKGLLRQSLKDLLLPHQDEANIGKNSKTLEDLIFGREGDESDDGVSSSVEVADATCFQEVKILEISRTAIGLRGIAKDTSLRTVESIAAGTVFSGTAHLNAPTRSAQDLGLRCALMTLQAVGGSRNRGAGACYVEIKNEKRSPGTLLKELLAELNKNELTNPLTLAQAYSASATKPHISLGDAVWLQVTFECDGALCCPEIPVVRNNHISSGYTVPASAVQGALLHALAKKNPELAEGVFASQNFRSWPLLPIPNVKLDESDEVMPVRISLSHRVSKLPKDLVSKTYEFRDNSIIPYNWKTVESKSPLKSADGVLLVHKKSDQPNRIALWRSAQMPRELSAHGVHHNGRNLFTVESMAISRYRGYVVLPKEAAEQVLALGKMAVAFGKARSVRGQGHWVFKRIQAPQSQSSAYIVQTPVAIPKELLVVKRPIHEVLAQLVQQQGWGEVELSGTTAKVGVIFGWNRHGKGSRINKSNRLQACPCILPGSVFVLKTNLTPQNLVGKLVCGLGEGREQGFGALVPHPGLATELHSATVEQRKLKSPDGAARRALTYHQETQKSGLSPSQIAALRQQLAKGKNEALDYLETQKKRPDRIYRCWKGVLAALTNDLGSIKSEEMQRTLRIWQDLAIANRKGSTTESHVVTKKEGTKSSHTGKEN